MSIASQASRVDYVGNGNTDEYDFTFLIFAETDLLVTVRDTDDDEETLVLTTDYTVDGLSDPAGGTITLVDGNLTSGYVLTIRRVRPLTQTTDIRNQGEFFPETHEDTFDHLTMVDQQQQDEINRSVKLPESISEDDFDPTLPTNILGQASMAISTNATGDGLALGEPVTIVNFTAKLAPDLTQVGVSSVYGDIYFAAGKGIMCTTSDGKFFRLRVELQDGIYQPICEEVVLS